MENQRDRVHIVTEYYSEGDLSNFIMMQVIFS